MSIIFSSCQKELDSPKNADDVIGTPLPGQTINCRIESIWENAGAYYQRFLLVLYDEYENPIAITAPEIGTGHPYLTFKYDSWHRLREYRGEYLGGGFEFWHFYGFDLSGRIGVDTLYTFGELANPQINYDLRIISKIEYDNQNRIVKTITEVEGSDFKYEANYTYDAAGNLTYPPDRGVTYDNKVNLYRINDIWMFLARDYSMNNPYIADAYNSSGFPTVINTNSGIPNSAFYDIPLNGSQVSYSCRQAYW
jgi:hypothetical protein